MSPSSVYSMGLSAQGTPRFTEGTRVLTEPMLNKDTAFTHAEREHFELRGRLPHRVRTLKEQVTQALLGLRDKKTSLEKYLYLTDLQDRNETLFYRLVMDHIEEATPLIYTPTVGEACLRYGELFRRPRGLYLSLADRGHLAQILRQWPEPDVRMFVVTDGERILGLGDLGTNGMGIPIGKLALYSACAGLHPSYCLPITLDVGTNNEALRNSPFYLGLPEPRVRGEAYQSFLAEFVEAVQTVFPKALVQWEDFGNQNAFYLLQEYQDKLLSFNDDIQGTAATVLAGLLSALRITQSKLVDQKLLFFGAGEAGTGIANLIVAAMVEGGLSEAEARARCWFVDSQGLVVKSRLNELAYHKQPYAHEFPAEKDLLSAINALKPTALFGVSGQGNTFNEQVLESMARHQTRPIIFALSNPTSKSECTAESAYRHTAGRAIFASGSPFAPVIYEGKTFVPGQGNNVYVFPGIGFGALAAEATHVTNEMLLAVARKLALTVTQEDLTLGRVYPSITRIREVSTQIAIAVAQEAHEHGLARAPRPKDIEADIRSRQFDPAYPIYASSREKSSNP